MPALPVFSSASVVFTSRPDTLAAFPTRSPGSSTTVLAEQISRVQVCSEPPSWLKRSCMRSSHGPPESPPSNASSVWTGAWVPPPNGGHGGLPVASSSNEKLKPGTPLPHA